MNQLPSSSKQASKSPRFHAVPAMSVFGLALSLLATGCQESSSGGPHEYPSEIETLAANRQEKDPVVRSQQRGREVYNHYCAICHGEDGQGNGFNSSQLAVPPRNFADSEFWKQTTGERVAQVIRDGGPGIGKSVLMPAWGRTLTARQLRDVVAFLQTLPEANTSHDDSEE